MDLTQTQVDRPPLTKINRLLSQCPVGVPMTSGWLTSQQVSPQLLQTYKRSGWLQPLGRGAWIRAGTQPSMAGSIFALQRQQLIVYPAARTALELQGRAHYLPVGESPVLQLSVESNKKLPSWFSRQAFARNLRILNASALFSPVYASVSDWHTEGLTLKISSPERAMLEYCYLLPKYADFEEARQLMEGLTTLRAQLLQSTLQACTSVKAKRLFLALASTVGHKWYGELNLQSIDLGAGKRSVISNGYLHPEFEITVPKTWVDS